MGHYYNDLEDWSLISRNREGFIRSSDFFGAGKRMYRRSYNNDAVTLSEGATFFDLKNVIKLT